MEKLDKLYKNLEGSILIIGFEDKGPIVRNLRDSKKITKLFTLNSNESSFLKRSRYKNVSKTAKKDIDKKKLDKKKVINIKKLYKELNKENFDYILCDFETILPYFRSYVRNSILVSNKKVLIYVNNIDYNLDEINVRYSRYGCNVSNSKSKNEYLYEIDTKDIKVTFYKRFIYWIRDIFYDLFEFIANIIIG